MNTIALTIELPEGSTPWTAQRLLLGAIRRHGAAAGTPAPNGDHSDVPLAVGNGGDIIVADHGRSMPDTDTEVIGSWRVEAVGPAERPKIGTLYLAPDGMSYRLRGYYPRFFAHEGDPEEEFPSYAAYHLDGGAGSADSLPEGSVVVWEPKEDVR